MTRFKCSTFSPLRDFDSGLVGSRRWPRRAFKRVDFPVLESPMMPIMAQANAANGTSKKK